MKRVIFLFNLLCVVQISATSQINRDNLNGNWIKYKVEMKDSSRVIDHYELENNYLKYMFSDDNIRVCEKPHCYLTEDKYTLTDSILYCGFSYFLIEKINDKELILLERRTSDIPDDKIRRYYFLKEDYALNVLVENKEYNMVNDSTILAYDFITPFIKNYGSQELYIDYFEKTKGDLIGYLIIDKKGKISEVQIIETDGIRRAIAKEIKKGLYKYGGTWILPNNRTLKNYNYKMEFEMHVDAYPDFGLYTQELIFYSQKLGMTDTGKDLVSFEDIKSAKSEFNKGNKFLSREDYQKAIKCYDKAINLDSLCIDAYYNRALSNMKLNNMEEACKDWLYLKQLGQKTAIGYYLDYCTNKN